MKLSGGQAAIEALKAERVGHVFGLIGSATMEMFDALYDADSIKFIGVHDERTGTHMADGYARVTGQAGVILAGQNGPGATNLVTGLAQAKAAFSPVVSIAGSLSSGHVYRDAFQEVDQQALFTPITKKTWTVTQTDRVPEMFREAFRTAMTPRRGPVQINLPRDVLSAQVEFDSLQSPEQYRAQDVPATSSDGVTQAVRMLTRAERPVIVAGRRHQEYWRPRASANFGRTAQLPHCHCTGSWRCHTVQSSSQCRSDGPAGQSVASRLVQEADVILALGTRLGFNSTFYSYDNIKQGCRHHPGGA